ncbi:MAG: plasmid pRiA4b ORF-3 family protein [Thermomicrobiales bacterium]|nr:plasmid pRiA4b ORF-3 family protein [Thermomicrobiales bacterium]
MLQAAFEWQDSHLHEFVAPENARTGEGARRFVTGYDPDFDPDRDMEAELETEITIGELLVKKGDTLTYLYDFGDGWEVTLKLEKSTKVPLARCVAGNRAWPRMIRWNLGV